MILIVCKVKEETSKRGENAYDKKRIGKILGFESYYLYGMA